MHKAIFSPNVDWEERVTGAKACIAAIHDLDINRVVKTRMLNHAIWELTRAQREADAPFRSEGVVFGDLGVKIQRDHVFRRAQFIEELDQGRDLDEILSDLLLCIVTCEEHRRLTQADKEDSAVNGWERYRRAGIKVFDCRRMEDGHFAAMTYE